MTNVELRARIDKTRVGYELAAHFLGLSRSALNKQMQGKSAVSFQTGMLLIHLERAVAKDQLHRLPGPGEAMGEEGWLAQPCER